MKGWADVNRSGTQMMNWLLIQTMPDPANTGDWLARWRWDNRWARGRTRAQAILALKESSTC